MQIKRSNKSESFKLEKLGFGKWFQNNTEQDDLENYEIVRVVNVHKDCLIVTNGENEIQAQLLGSLMYTAQSPADLPTIGDFVFSKFYDEGTLAIVHDVLPRKSVLKRKTPGKKIDFQLIAANIDTAFIMQSLDDDFSLRRFERYLSMVYESNIVPVILLSKSDLLSSQAVEDKIDQVNKVADDVQVHAFSSTTGKGLENIKSLLVEMQTYCLLGSSGVGKTTLLNHLLEDQKFETQSVRRKDSKGRHTTTNRVLTRLKNGAMIIDNPGMRELGIFSVAQGLDETFSEILDLAKACKFSDCSHINQKGCAILKALDDGELDQKRYQNFIGMKKESEFYDMSYLEKKKKDKAFGKMVKTAMKFKKR